MTDQLPVLEEFVRGLPPPRRIANARSRLRAGRGRRVLAVLDDDPTGTQTVQDVPVYLGWSDELIEEALASGVGCFYLSTNSRSLSPAAAATQAHGIGRSLALAEKKLARGVTVASRSDSTLRGHFPEEVEALVAGLGQRPDGIILVPAFFDGGRYTLGDTHWVNLEGRMTPAADTEYASDPHFGYHHSNLREWVEEKTHGRVRADEVRSLSLDLIRKEGVSALVSELKQAEKETHFVVNALEDADLEVVALALLEAETAGKRFLLRCAASMVKVYAGIEDAPCLRLNALGTSGPGLILVGSYVQRTTGQVQALLRVPGVTGIEVPVDGLTSDHGRQLIVELTREADASLSQNRTTVLFTSRERKDLFGSDFLDYGRNVMSGLTTIVKNLKIRPGFVVAKGGITSYSVAVEGLSASRARVLGQIAAGVPLWEIGAGAKWEGIPYVVFPGNVGSRDALAMVVTSLTTRKPDTFT